MPVLAYCTFEFDPQIRVPEVGVQGEPISLIRESKLACLVSQFTTVKSGSNEPLREAALVFNRVLQAVFQQAAIVPFRFPTLVENEREISRYLQERESELLRDLHRFREMVQMEIEVQSDVPATIGQQQSGQGYLRTRQARAAVLEGAVSDLRSGVKSCILEWRTRPSANRTRCYVLLQRSALHDFCQKAKSVRLPDDIRARMTGPWPVSEFMSET